jgi:dienelactone hydrolase
MASRDSLSDFTTEQVTLLGRTRTVYRKGSGPAVIVMSEIPGITPTVANFARTVADAGCTVVMPHLFGDDGEPPTSSRISKVFGSVCVSKEFTVMARGKSSPVVAWLRALAVKEHERCGGPGVGAVGMCMTGGFALAMTVESSVIAPVLSQPSMPMAPGFLAKRNGGHIDISSADMAAVKHRMEADPELCVLGFRYSGDALVPTARFEMLERELGDRFIGRSFASNNKADHSVLTEQLQTEALNDVLAFFQRRLQLAPTYWRY